MGGCLSAPSSTEEANVKSKEIGARGTTSKILVLGSGDSGKSTLAKQLQLIYSPSLVSPQEIEYSRQNVLEYVVCGLQYLVQDMHEMELEVSTENMKHLKAIESLRAADYDIKPGEPFPMRLYETLKALWTDPNVQKAWERNNDTVFYGSLSYYFSSLDRLFGPEYRPDEQDMIRHSYKSTGITEKTFRLRDHRINLFDVSGRRSERRKWIYCFEGVTSILFMVSLNCYDQCLLENSNENRMQDAMTLWESICQSRWFGKTSIILLLNKKDQFEEKVKHSDIKNFFPDFDGEPGDAEAGIDYFMTRFAKIAKAAGRSGELDIPIHVISATDTAMVRAVLATVEGAQSLQCHKIENGN